MPSTPETFGVVEERAPHGRGPRDLLDLGGEGLDDQRAAVVDLLQRRRRPRPRRRARCRGCRGRSRSRGRASSLSPAISMALPRCFSSMLAWKVSIITPHAGLPTSSTSSSACSVRLMKLVSKRLSGSSASLTPLLLGVVGRDAQVLRRAGQVFLAHLRRLLPLAAHGGVERAGDHLAAHRRRAVDAVLEIGDARFLDHRIGVRRVAARAHHGADAAGQPGPRDTPRAPRRNRRRRCSRWGFRTGRSPAPWHDRGSAGPWSGTAKTKTNELMPYWIIIVLLSRFGSGQPGIRVIAGSGVECCRSWFPY